MKLSIAAVVIILLALLVQVFRRAWSRRIPWRIRSARRALKTLRAIRGDYANQQRFAYLRKLDPFVFEELVLLCFSERGLRVKRSPYTRDGGIDGTVWLNDQRPVLVQSKRYARHIQAHHVREFAQLLARRHQAGVFVHTGRTGKASWQASRQAELQMISGPRLQRLILGQPMTLFNTALTHTVPQSDKKAPT
ncbi:MAG: restriction endonuclease [Pseudomonadales bacterium]